MPDLPLDTKTFLEGLPGTGKTTLAVGRMLDLLAAGVPGSSILVLTPQRTLATPYFEALRSPEAPAGEPPVVLTVGGLARRNLDLFWPLVAADAGFAHPAAPPIFLTLETAQYFMDRVIEPLLAEGYFDGVTIQHSRLVSQVLDNLNKAAVVGFSHREIAVRLKRAWAGESSRKRIYDEAQTVALRFRDYCLAHNLLDFSLQLEVFFGLLLPMPVFQGYLFEQYRHLIVDNVEEDTPVAHDLLSTWLSRPELESALLVYDRDGGYRVFLGADPEGGYVLRDLCDERVGLDESHVTSPDMEALGYEIGRALNRPVEARRGDVRQALAFAQRRFHPQMLDWTADEIARLVHEAGVSPGEIVVLAPFLSDALRFSLTHKLEQRGIQTWSHRPSRALREEPAARCLLTLAALAHPQWERTPHKQDVAQALMQAVADLDLVRARLLTEITYRLQEGQPLLTSFDHIRPEVQARIGYRLGERFEGLRVWLDGYPSTRPSSSLGAGAASDETALDHFWGQLFSEVLSQPGYGFHGDYDAGQVTANLIESVNKFRRALGDVTFEGESPGKAYVEMVDRGVLAAQYVAPWQAQPEDAVLLAPAYTFLMSNRPVDYQFWLKAGSSAWWERIYQPLTHPYVLTRRWAREKPDEVWSDADEFEVRQAALYRLTVGLLRRCRKKVFLGISDLGEQGYEEKGPLLRVIQWVLREVPE
jgi:hypothetical protein